MDVATHTPRTFGLTSSTRNSILYCWSRLMFSPFLSRNTDGNDALTPGGVFVQEGNKLGLAARKTVSHRSVQCIVVIGKLGGVRRQNIQRYIRPGLRLLPGSEHDNPHNNGQHKNRRPDRQNQCG